jgi:multidrug efflux system membrane fusion protein
MNRATAAIGAVVVAAALGWAAYSYTGGGHAAPSAPANPPVPVTPGTAETRDMPIYVRGIGTVQAFNTVAVKSRVDGQIVKVDFTEGQEVKAGDPLFEIDPRPFQAALAQANAAKEKDQAQLTTAEADLKRYAQQVGPGYQTRQTFDQQKGLVGQLQAAIKADQAAIDNANLNLTYATIRSPIDGRTGSLQLNLGNVVRSGGTSDSTLLVINQVQPVYVSFTVPQQQLPQIKRFMAAGTLTVEAIASGETRPERGTVTFIDNAVDQNTGTIRLKATFANGERRLWPGQFVNVALTLAVEPDAIVVPAQAVQSGQQGAFVFVVKPDSTVDTRRIVVARTQGSEAVVASGLAPGESVVTDGQPRLVQGARVEVRGPAGRQAAGERSGTSPGAAASPPGTSGGPVPAAPAPRGAAAPSR